MGGNFMTLGTGMPTPEDEGLNMDNKG